MIVKPVSKETGSDLVTASGGKVILAFGTPVEWIGMTPRMAHQLADALNKWASET